MSGEVLFVCHANLCRSPMAEYLARHLLAGWSIPIASAGTDALDGHPMHPYAATVAEAAGDPGSFRSRMLRHEHLAEAALILTATRQQRSICVSMTPAAVHRTFTLRQFGRLAAVADPPDGMASVPIPALVTAARQARSRLQPAGPHEDDLADPVGGSLADFRRCGDQIEAALSGIVRLIRAAG